MQITPTLANDIDYSKARFPLAGFRKVDGVRASHFVSYFHGRSMDPFKNTALNAKFSSGDYAGGDGELTIDGRLTGSDLCSLTTGLVNRATLKKGETELPSNAVWNLFDWVSPDTIALPYGRRHEIAKERAQGLASVHVLDYVIIEDATQADDWFGQCLDDDCEGAIYRELNALHKSGRASKKDNDFWRAKPTSDKDAVVIYVYEAEENLNEAKTNSLGRTERSSHQENKVGKGMAGGFVSLDVTSGKEIRVPVGKMKHDERIWVWEHRDEVVGRAFKYRSLDTGVKDQPRQGRWICWRAKEDMS